LALTPGTRLGVYEITAPIGEGGMGQVYRARDPKLNRDVALKILPDAFANDPDRLARFTREAQTLASLNHPNIAQIHGLEEYGGIRALVMELVEGDDLSQRIARGAMPIDDALTIATQIALALEAAHEQNIIHRDLKPANIKVRPDGTVKVLDFGLAKAIGPGSEPLSDAPTMRSPAMTEAGIILGTAAYMSPEQARGKTVDKRTDIWAFGCVLYEMLTGTRAFGDDDVSMTISKILQREPDFDALPSSVPARVSQVLRVCLRKDPKQRVADIRDVRLALDGAFETVGPQTTTTSSAADRGRLWMAAFAVATLACIAMAVPTLRYLREVPAPAPGETRLDFVTPATNQPLDFALSPDGRRLLIESGENIEALDLARGAWARLAAATLSTVFSTWSADGKRVVFRRFASPFWVASDGSRVTGAVPGGIVSDFPSSPGPDPDSFSALRIRPETSGDVFLMSISGVFEPKPLIVTKAYEGGAQLSPDGRWLLYQSDASGRPEISVRSYPGLDRQWQVSDGGGVQARWSRNNREIYYRSGRRLVGATLNASGAEPVFGKPVALFTDDYDFGAGASIANYDVTADGRFIMIRRGVNGGKLRVVVNWTEELRQILASGGVR
jgi:Protein kinase domain/WD40-like Beta Propeller Repeat